MKKTLLGLVAGSLMIILLGALAAETADKLLIEPRTVSSWGELVENYLDFRLRMGPIVPPSVSYKDSATQMKAGDFSFLAKNWHYKFSGGTCYVAKDSKLAKLKLPLHIQIYEDLQRGEIVVLSSIDGEKFQGEALFKAPEFMPYEKDFSLDLYAFDELAPRRVVWEITLKAEADAWSDLVFRRNEAVTSKLLEDSGMFRLMSVPEASTNDLWLCLEPQTNNIYLNVFAPEGFTNQVEIYSSTDLVSEVWGVARQNLYPGTNPAVWDVTSDISTRFFRAGNMDIDGDMDGINDAREQIVHKTDPAKWDTDGDWLSDSWELTNSLNALVSDAATDSDNDGLGNRDEYQYGTDPFDADSDNDGLSDGAEVSAGTNPLQADTDGDSLPDAWEVRFGYDPVNKAEGALSGADQTGQFDTDGSVLAVEVRDDMAYVADGTNGLVLLDVRHPGGRLLSSLPLEGDANDLLLTNDTLWVALGSNGVAAVDVSDPFRPQMLGSHFTGGYSRGLALQSNLLYIANTAKDLLILNVQYPDDIVQMAQYSAALLEGRDICISGTNAWLVLEDRIYLLDVSNPSNPVYILNNGNAGYDIGEMKRIGTNFYIAAGNGGFSIWNSGLSTSIGTFNTESPAYGFGMESNRVLIAEGVNFAELVDVSNEGKPVLITGIAVGGFVKDAVLSGERGYLAAGDGGLVTVRFSTDGDADGMNDNWEILHFGSISASATNDFDGDGIFNREEFMIGTNPAHTDSDADGLSDHDEVLMYCSDPTRADGDLDGLSDYAEINTYGTDAGNADADTDGMSDGWEVLYGLNPLIADGNGDADSDGLFNLTEYQHHTNPLVSDSDGDGLSDAWEVFHGISNTSTNRPLRASFEQVAMRDTAGDARGIVAADGYLYVADGSNGLAVLDLSIPSAPALVATLDTAGFAYDVVVSNQYAYVADGINGLVIIAVSNPVSPSVSGHCYTTGTAFSVYLQGSYAYIADGSNGMPVINISNPSAPSQTGRYPVSLGRATDVCVKGTNAYLTYYASNGGSLYRIGISNPSAPVWQKGTGLVGADFLSVAAAGSFVYVGTRSATRGPQLCIWSDISLTQIAYLGLGAAGEGLCIRSNYLYVACGDAGISVIDISAPSSPAFLHSVDTAGHAYHIFPSGEYVYAADGTNGVVVFRFVEDIDEDGISDFWERAYFGNLSQAATNDFDGDGISNWAEYMIAGNPSTNDADGDLLSDYAEIWTYHTQPLNRDTDFDGRSDRAELLGLDGAAATDPLDADCDSDGLKDGEEITAGSNPHLADTDGDNMPDGWEVQNGLSPTVSNASSDHDYDGLNNLAEYQYGSKANTADTDNDGLEDGAEVTAGTGLLNPDSDGDGLLDGAEVHTHSTNPLNAHSDSDSMPDGWEVANGLNPLGNDASSDRDYDGLTNEQEYQYGTRADDNDSDNDGYSDYYEITHGLNPVSGDSDGDGISDAMDELPDGFKVMIPAAVTNHISYTVYYGLNDGTSPKYAGTYAYHPWGLPTNTAINITNVCLTNGYVYDACQIAKYPSGYARFSWDYGPSSFSSNITGLVSNRLGGAITNGFDIEVYHWFNSYGDPTLEFAELFTDCVVQFQKETPIVLNLIPDYDRDGMIGSNDLNRVRAGQLFRFWVNDDDDSGYDGGRDISGDGRPNYSDGQVNGVRDLIDFFPVQIVVSNSTPEYISSTNGYRWYLCHDDSALNAVQTTLTTNNAGNYLRNVSAASGLAGAAAYPITQSGWRLPASFADTLFGGGQGVVLIEARSATVKPLRLELRRMKSGGSEETLGVRELPLSITGVEQMFRHKNLRPNPSEPDRNSATNELPSSGKNFVFVHGYNVSEKAAQGWNAEMFKRLYWSGSNARFYGVTWRGDQSQLRIPILGMNVTPRYHVNVVNALNTAPGLKTWLTGTNGPNGSTIVAGHSLGNMLVGSAIDGVAIVTNWFMIDGAVAIENFDGSAGAQSTNMIHPDWLEYSNRLWCSEWYKLFGTGDSRKQLTWRDCFTNSLSKTYNFYSSGEEVLETHTGDPGFWDYTSGSDAWCLQEKRKGRNWFSSIGGSTHGGWGFGEYDRDDYAGSNQASLSDAQLCRKPFFDAGGGYGKNLCDPYNGSSFAAANRNELLAGFIPSRTLPCGANIVPALGDRNFNMNTPAFQNNGWPRGDNRWLHSHIREISYLYVNKVFDKFVTEGELK